MKIPSDREAMDEAVVDFTRRLEFVSNLSDKTLTFFERLKRVLSSKSDNKYKKIIELTNKHYKPKRKKK